MNRASQQLNRRDFLRQAAPAATVVLGVTGPGSRLAAAQSNASAAIQIGILLGTFGSGTLEAHLDAVRACGLDCVQGASTAPACRTCPTRSRWRCPAGFVARPPPGGSRSRRCRARST